MRSRYSVVLMLGVSALAWACSSSDGGEPGHAEGGTGGSSSRAAIASGGALNSGGAPSGGGRSMSAGAPSGGSVGGAPSGGGATGRGGAASSGGTSAAGSAGSAGAGGGIAVTKSCPAFPVGAADAAVTAINSVNAVRLAMGVECANLVLNLDKSAQAHCAYYAGNASNSLCESDSISPHDEVASCTGFTGADPGARVKAAGYVGRGWGEVMAFDDDPNEAIMQWINSVWHRTPLLSPWWDDMGYGNATKCDVIDLGPGTQSPATATAIYPYAGQTGVARSFNGANEGPVPPAPATGWPSGLPITLYVQNATVVSHSIEVMGSGVPLAHVFIDYNQSDNDTDQLILYTNAPFAANTSYHVTIAVTISGAPKTFDWTFTTGS